MLLNNSSMVILYRALLATSRSSINVTKDPLKKLSSRITLFHVRVLHRASSGVVKGCPKWHVLMATPLGALLYHRLTPNVVQCKTRSSASQQLLLRKARRNASSSEVIKFNWTRLVKLMLPDILLLAGAVVSAIVAAIINIRIPLLLGDLVNVVARLETGHELQYYLNDLRTPAIKLAAHYLAQGLLTFMYISMLFSVGERVAVRMRMELFQSLMQQDISFFDVNKTGELVNRLTTDVQEFKSSFKQCVSQGLRSVTQIVGCVVSLYTISPQMTGVVATCLPVMIATGSFLGAVLRRWSRQAQEQVEKATAYADEAIGNIRTVRAFAMENKELELYQHEVGLSCAKNEKFGYGVAVFQGVTNIAINSIVLGVVSYGGMLMATNQVSPGDLMSFLVATQTIQRSLGAVSVLLGQIVRGTSAGARVFEFTDLRPSIPIHSGLKLPLADLRGEIELKGVSFTYPSRAEQLVLKNLDLKILPGKVTALCGPSGSGKSTIAALLERFYDPQEGGIYVDGNPLQELDPSWLRGQAIGYINQEPVLFATTVMENIRYGNPLASDEQVYNAAVRANADGFIRSFPDGYDTVVGERGHAVSGGQKQRIAIARALLKDPKIIILDEATSALDAESERLVQQALDVLQQGRTVLVIAHRLSTIQNADSIVVLSDGRIKEIGTHSELMKKKGLYAELVRRQTMD